jgi:dihydroxyacetone kinase-like protein
MSARATKLINDPADIVAEMLEGYTAAHSGIVRLESGLVIRSHPKPEGRVGLVIGNGSGHEPAMIGWVGYGLFDVNVPGPIFTAPGPAALLKGIRSADRGAGVLLCVSNHAGDVLNAELALEFAADQGVENVEIVVLYDDVGSAPKGNESERRGAAGLFFVWKILGAYAEAGASLSECKSMAETIRDRTRTLSATLASCTHPVTAIPLAEIPEGMMVVGAGVHGESSGTFVPVGNADGAVALVLPLIIEDLPYREGDHVCVLINDAGGLTVMELSILYRAVERTLTERGIEIHASWLGRYATTQDTAGFSISLCRVDPETEQLYDAPAQGAGVVFADALAAEEVML